jgi:hypothetical protein
LEQRAVVEFVLAEGEKLTSIHDSLLNMYGEATVDANTVRNWIRQIKEAETGAAALHDKPQSGCTCTVRGQQ